MAALGVDWGTSPALEVGRFRGRDTGDWLARPRQLGGGNRDAIGQSSAKRRQSWLDVPCSMVWGATCSRYATVWVNFFASVLRNWHPTQHMDRAGCRWPGLGCRRCLAKSKSQWDLCLIPCSLLGEVPFYSTILWDDLGFYIINFICMIYHDWSLYLSGVDVFKQWFIPHSKSCGAGRGRAALLVRPRWLGCGLQGQDTKLDPLTACLVMFGG